MAKKKGSQKTGGRVAGTPNKITANVREVVLNTFNTLQEDPENNLTAFAIKQPVEFYRIAAKLIPTDIKADVRHTGKVILEIKRGQRSND